jgi:hypothetical protein
MDNSNIKQRFITKLYENPVTGCLKKKGYNANNIAIELDIGRTTVYRCFKQMGT